MLAQEKDKHKAANGNEGRENPTNYVHLDRYVDEFVGRHNARPMDTAEQMAIMTVQSVGKRLPYSRLIGSAETRQPRGVASVKKNNNSKTPTVTEGELEITEFKGKGIRKILRGDEWYFSVVDVIEAIVETDRPSKYWNDLKKRMAKEGYDELSENIGQLKMQSADGKFYMTDAANTETIFRVIQSIPSKEAERFKRWLARVGYERILETQDPDVAIKRAIADYRAQGHDDEWIDARVRSRLAREELTSEWARRDIQGNEYGILTNVIQEGTFNLGVQPHMALKGLNTRQNLRDHMTSLELLFTTLGERSTKDIAIADNAKGFQPNKVAAKKGGKVAGDAREALEKQTGQKVVSNSNFLRDRRSPKELPESKEE